MYLLLHTYNVVVVALIIVIAVVACDLNFVLDMFMSVGFLSRITR